MKNREKDSQWFVRHQLDAVATIEARLITAIRSGRKEDIIFVMNDLDRVFDDCFEASTRITSVMGKLDRNGETGYNLGRVMHAATSVLEFGKGAIFALEATIQRTGSTLLRKDFNKKAPFTGPQSERVALTSAFRVNREDVATSFVCENEYFNGKRS